MEIFLGVLVVAVFLAVVLSCISNDREAARERAEERPKPTPPPCNHDWEVVATDESIVMRQNYSQGGVAWAAYTKDASTYELENGYHPSQSVCMKCGKCLDKIGEAKKWIADREARKVLAKKMFEEGCKN